MTTWKLIILRLCYWLGCSSQWLALLKVFTAALGTMWLIVKAGSFAFPGPAWNSDYVKWGLLLLPIMWSLVATFPRLKFSIRSKALDTEIEVKVGDILAEKAHLVIGCNDCFDTALPVGDKDLKIISPTSVQGQFQEKYYGLTPEQIDREIDESLQNQQVSSQPDTTKVYGKQARYPIGTVATLNNRVNGSQRRVHLLAFARMLSEKPTALAETNDLWLCLGKLWGVTRHDCQLEPICMPILGKGYGRLGLSAVAVAQLIVLSFVIASVERKVTKKLSIVIYSTDYDPGDMAHLVSFLKSIRF